MKMEVEHMNNANKTIICRTYIIQNQHHQQLVKFLFRL